MENNCQTCKIEIPLMGLTGRKRKFCSESCKLFYTNHVKHFDIELATMDSSVCETEDDYRLWAEEWCLDNKGAYRRKILEERFSIAIGLGEFISNLNRFIDNHPTNELLSKRSEQFNAWLRNTSRSICPVCEKKYPGFNQTKWRVYCSEKCCNIAKRNGGDIRQTIDDVCIEKYGAKGGFTKERVNSFEDIIMERYGVRNSMQLKSTIEKSMSTRKGNGFLKISKGEQELYEFVLSLGLDAKQSDHSLISKELDILIPEKKVAIEYNGCYYHSEANGGEASAKVRHVDKTNDCEDKGYQLIHIWEDEWKLKREVVENMLRVKLGVRTNTIFARKTKVVKNCDSYKLLDSLHIQGNGQGSVRYGLELDDKLVAIMCFIKRPEDGVWELNRYAADNVIGGFSKLLRAFQRNEIWSKIVSFGDRCVVYRHKNTYTQNGFKEVRLNPPDYKYTRGLERHHKFGFRKKLLAKKYNFDESMSEHEMAKEAKFFRIYNAGLIKYELTKKAL